MMLIRQAQLDALSRCMLSEFEARMVDHFQEHFAEWSQSLGPVRLAEFVRYGIDRAHRYGFEVELDLARYLHIMQALGKTFDESEHYPWAQSLLTGDLAPSAKTDRLRDAVDYSLESRRIRDAHQRRCRVE